MSVSYFKISVFLGTVLPFACGYFESLTDYRIPAAREDDKGICAEKGVPFDSYEEKKKKDKRKRLQNLS